MFAAEEPLNTLPEGTVLDGKFRIVRCIGMGGMGAVYEIQHELTKHRRALKMLHKHFAGDREAVERFLREASAAGRIGNTHITETFDAGWLSTGEPYLVMEFLEGKALDELLSDNPLPLDVSLVLIAQACRAVHAAHTAGIVHRDLKPENLFIIFDEEGQPFVKVLDFGIGKFEDARAASRATLEGAFMGTPYYMSPEQFIDGTKVDGKSDVYSLGVILFECVTGQHPYPCDTLARLATKIMVEEPPTPSSVRAGLPPGVDAVLARALRKRADDRFQSAEAMAIELERLSELGNLTLPQGSSWQSQYPPSKDVRAARAAFVAEGTVKVFMDEPADSVSPETSETRSSPPWWLGAIVAGGLVAVVVAVVALTRPSDSSETKTPASSASPPPASAPAASAPRASSPSASAASTSSAAASAAPRVPTARPSSKPDYATVEEFPD